MPASFVLNSYLPSLSVVVVCHTYSLTFPFSSILSTNSTVAPATFSLSSVVLIPSPIIASDTGLFLLSSHTLPLILLIKSSFTVTLILFARSVSFSKFFSYLFPSMSFLHKLPGVELISTRPAASLLPFTIPFGNCVPSL